MDSLNERAYAYRYKQIDSTRYLAQTAYQFAEQHNYINGKAEALNHLMFERFQQMDFDSIVRMADHLDQLSASDVEQLACDVMRMKVDQRTSDNRAFFEHRNHALRCLKHIARQKTQLTPHERRRLVHAQSDLHIVTSTYFYYVDQRERALNEIREAESYSQLHQDTAQWLYYCYMRGSGGLAESQQQKDITLEEFDYLIRCFTLSRYSHYPFFEANSTQSLATLFADSLQRSYLEDNRKEVVNYLTAIFGTDSTAMNMAQWALTQFREYDDLYQTACALRTLGELQFNEGHFADAITFYTNALNCVNFHHDIYYDAENVLIPSGNNMLLPYDPDAGEESVEQRWFSKEGVRTIPEWIAGIREQLSVAYSAMNMKQGSDYNRNIYIDMLELTREDAELESRAAELHAESKRLHQMLVVVAIAAIVVVLLTILLFRSWRRRGEDETRELNRQFQQLQKENLQRNAELEEEREQLQEQQQATERNILKNKRLNVEKRAKMSLVHGIVPFLDRILHEVDKMMRAGRTNEHSLEYIQELIQPINDYNDLLTEWIRMEQGQLSLKLTSFDLEPLFAAIRKSHFVYEQKGLTLIIDPTELRVKADRALTLFMINTLADNARKFTPQGGSVTISASEGTSEEGPYVELSVKDTGCGLDESDIELILQNKVYDATTIGNSSQDEELSKGFGFGLMNCKGIIEKYRKTSPLFKVCQMGIESKVGEGSRFFFRLPRVMLTLWLALCSLNPMHATSTPPQAYELMDSVYYSNIQGRYVDALSYAEDVIAVLNTMGMEEHMELRPVRELVAETAWWSRHEKVDYSLLLGLRNEIAVAALALHDWPLYRTNNSIYKRLYKLLGQDPTLEAYCRQTELTHEHQRMALFAVVLLFIAGLSSLYLLWFRPLLSRRRANAELSVKRLEQLRAEQEQEHQRVLENMELAEDEHNRRLYEEGRLHVQNQIIDNCLSTIKHETMYYPGRILQLAEKQPVDLTALSETASYYKEIFTLLSAQAESQSAAIAFHRGRQTFSQLLGNLKARSQTKAYKRAITLQFFCEDSTEDRLILADADLIQILLDELIDYEINTLAAIADNVENVSSILPAGRPNRPAVASQNSSNTFTLSLSAKLDERFIRITLVNPYVPLSQSQLHNLFMPHPGGIPLLIVKQIIREHDTFMGHPGCRIMAEPSPPETEEQPSGNTLQGTGHAIWFTLPLVSAKH